MTHSATSSLPARATEAWKVLRTGLGVLGAELCWVGSGIMHDVEVRQLRKRITREEAALGRTMLEAASPEALQAIEKRIAFLHEEIERFATSREMARARHVARLRERFGVANDNIQP